MEWKLTWFGTKYNGSVFYSPTLVDVHCIICEKCAENLPYKSANEKSVEKGD